MEIALDNIRQAEGILDELNGLKENIENRINLSQVAGNEKRVLLTGNKIMRICLIAGLNVAEKRSMEHISNIQLSKSSIRIPSSFFTHNNLRSLYSALLKIRYRDFKIDWNDNPTVSRIIAAEMFRGRDYLLNDNKLPIGMYRGTFRHWNSLLENTTMKWKQRLISTESPLPILKY